MKLTNLSLAVMVAVGVAACGGSGDDNSNKPADPPKQPTPNQPQQPQQPEAPTNPQQAVDPTGTQVVDDKDLTKQNTVGTLQYIRRDGSQYDRVLNPSKPASASPLLGTTLNEQNPRLTNIVLARQDITRADGTPVKAQFTGSDNPMPLNAAGEAIKDSVNNENSLQEENFNNVDVLAGLYKVPYDAADRTVSNVDDFHNDFANNLDDKKQIKREPVLGSQFQPVYQYSQVTADGKRMDPTLAGDAVAGIDNATTIKTATAIMDKHAVNTGTNEVVKKSEDGSDIYTYRGFTTASAPLKARNTVTLTFANGDKGGTRYGKGLVWWTAPEQAFENYESRGGTREAHDIDVAVNDSLAATNGLVRVGGGLSTLGQELNYNKEENKWEDHQKTSTRIFGHYHLAYADTQSKSPGVKPVELNSFSGAKSFIAEYETEAANAADAESKVGKTTQYSIGAIPSTLKHVQYGRVTTNLDLDAGKDGYPDGFIRSPFANKGDDNTVDNYFYRGTDATTIEQMAALPNDQKAVYQGHALMYGIDNSYHGGGGRNLPNAFAGTTNGLGLGNFVEARVDFGKKRVLGDVYNEWLLDPSKAATTRDNLVRFQGNIIGNTVIGSADRTYIAGDDCAIFKASFFGEKAEEMGGSFNTVQDTSKYGDAYGQNDWGGVFGASKGSATSNTFQGDDGNNNYGQNNYGQL